MKFKKLSNKFFQRSTLKVASDLIGKLIIRRQRNKIKIVRILETEAYIGEKDLACHASKGKTKRNFPMYEKGGTFYVYLVYGMHWMFNVVTENRNFPAAVLIRVGEIADNSRPKILNGPARLTKELNINKRFSGKKADRDLFFAQELPAKKYQTKTARRVGVEYAGQCAQYPWRFILKR